jgi:hypothetical protein
MPGWSDLMEMVCTGSNPGLSNITFLPMIDLNHSDMSCVYSTLKFVSKEASHHNRTPVITFDQPLYWKALIIMILIFGVLTPLSTIFQLYHGDQF